MSLESSRKIGIQEEERERMVKVLGDEGMEKRIKTLRQASSGKIRRRCNSCDLEWDSAHGEEPCPLRELETAFLPEDWFMVVSEQSVDCAAVW